MPGRDYTVQMNGPRRPWGKKNEGWQAIFAARNLEGGHSLSETNNSDGLTVRKPDAKSAEMLRITVDEYVKAYEPREIHFVTITVADKVQDEREFARRVNNVRNAILKRYHGGIRVFERHKSGVVHMHLVLIYRRGAGLRQVKSMKRGKRWTLESPGPGWLELWAWWRNLASRYNFGRVECLPVRKPERAGNYCAKYLTKGEYHWQKGTRVSGVWKLRVIRRWQFGFAGGMARTHRQFMRWLTDTGGTVELEEAALARMKDLWGESEWMKTIWWHVKNGYADFLKAQWLGMIGIDSPEKERRDFEAGRRWFETCDLETAV